MTSQCFSFLPSLNLKGLYPAETSNVTFLLKPTSNPKFGALVKSQLASTDALLVEVYSAGNTDVVFTQAPSHYELLISNKHRAIRETEVEKIREFFLKRKIDLQIIDQSAIKTLYSDKLIEISFPITK